MAASVAVCLRRCATRINIRSVAALHLSSKTCASPDKLTHTGQKWDATDYRLARFTDRVKEGSPFSSKPKAGILGGPVNENFAIDMIAEVPPKEVHGRSVYCDGGGGALGHPKVYINLDQGGPHICGYCGLRFVMASDHH